MRGSGGALCVAVAALLVCCSADPHQDSDVNDDHTGERFDANGQKAHHMDSVGGNLVREVRDSGHGFVPYLMARQHYYGAAGGKRELWPMSPSKYTAFYGDGYPKRNFDEIDLSGLNNFVRKRNIDEIDQTSMPFPYAKRFYHVLGPNHNSMSSFDKKRYRADYPMDEIDLSHFPIGSKRSQGFWPLR